MQSMLTEIMCKVNRIHRVVGRLLVNIMTAPVLTRSGQVLLDFVFAQVGLRQWVETMQTFDCYLYAAAYKYMKTARSTLTILRETDATDNDLRGFDVDGNKLSDSSI